jgi:hypothetical protein
MCDCGPGRIRAARSSLLHLFSFLVLGLVPATAFAQAVDVPNMVIPGRQAPPTFAMVQYGHQFETDVDDPTTEFERNDAKFAVGHRLDFNEKTSVLFVGQYALQAYDFSGNSGPPLPSNPSKYQWDDIHRISLMAMLGHQLTDEWQLVGVPLVTSRGEGGSDFGDTITGGALLGFNYEPNPDFSIGLLLGVFSQLEGGVGILPVPILNWHFAEDWYLKTGLVTVFDSGIGAELTWQIAENLSLGTGIAYQSRQYRLDDDDVRAVNTNLPTRTDKGGAGYERAVPVFAMLRWRPTKASTIDLLGGVNVGGSLRVEDDKGGRIADDGYDPAGFLGVKAGVLF